MPENPCRPLDVALARELEVWRSGDPGPDGRALAHLLTQRIRRVGRHAIPASMLDSLAEIAQRHRGRDPFLDDFLDAVLARHQDRFHNASYLLLPLLARILDSEAELDPERLSALLLADVVRHERRQRDCLDPAVSRKRIRHAARFVSTVDPALADDATPPATRAGEWLALSALPVSTEHDEYFFIRALQAHELVFTTQAALLRSATEAVRDGRPDDATALVDRATTVFGRSSLLFRLVATMRAAAFHAFREHTDGASAIQSESYKRFELTCGEPGRARLDSEAFAGVPAVRAEAEGHDSLARALADLPAGPPAGLAAAVADLEATHQRWKTTHHSLAVRMLGDARGSGYSAGVPYLAACRDLRLVRACGTSAA